MTKDQILSEIRRTAADNGGRPLGRQRFVQVTGISDRDWGRHWARFSEAQREAGFEPNTMNFRREDDFVMEKLVGLIRELQKVPTTRELRLQRHREPGFPSQSVFARYGGQTGLLAAVLAFGQGRPGYEDVVAICEPAYEEARLARATPDEAAAPEATTYGFVYMVKGRPGEYKIGRSNLVDRRVAQLVTASAVALTPVYRIKTDDPAGVEAYWHRRFADRRMHGEWFKLRAADVAAFKRWKRIA